MIVMASLMMTISAVNACDKPKKDHESPIEELCRALLRRFMRITCPTDGSITGIQIDVKGTFMMNIPHPNERWWILVNPTDSNLVHPGAPIDFSFYGRWKGTWQGRHSIYLTGDPAQSKQPFRIMVAQVTPQTDRLYKYRLAHQIYDYLELQPGTIIFDCVIVQRLQ